MDSHHAGWIPTRPSTFSRSRLVALLYEEGETIANIQRQLHISQTCAYRSLRAGRRILAAERAAREAVSSL